MSKTVITASAEAPRYEFGVAEPKWQRVCAERDCFGVDDVPADGKPKYVERARGEPALLWPRGDALETLSHLILPTMVHLAEQVYAWLQPDSTRLVAELAGRQPDPPSLAPETVTSAVQVIGKLRGAIAAPADAPALQVNVMPEAESNVARVPEDKRVVKRIHVPNRIVNFVVAG